MEIITRREATVRRLVRYYTGKPCKHGHLVERNTKSGMCLACKATENKTLRANKPEHYREKYKEYQRRFIQRHPEKAAEINRVAGRKWIKNNPEKVKAKVEKRQEAIRVATPTWANLELIDLVERKAKELGFKADHIVPIQSKFVCGLHVWENLQLLDHQLNASKGNRWWPDMPE